MASVFDVAKYILEKTHETMPFWKLHHLIYYAYAYHLASKNEKLFPELVGLGHIYYLIPKLCEEYSDRFILHCNHVKGDITNLTRGEIDSIDFIVKAYSRYDAPILNQMIVQPYSERHISM